MKVGDLIALGLGLGVVAAVASVRVRPAAAAPAALPPQPLPPLPPPPEPPAPGPAPPPAPAARPFQDVPIGNFVLVQGITDLLNVTEMRITKKQLTTGDTIYEGELTSCQFFCRTYRFAERQIVGVPQV